MKNSKEFNLNRRELIKGATGLGFLLGAGGISQVVSAAHPQELETSPWLSIHTDGRITIVFPSTEMGQSSFSTLPQFVAEELDADW